MAGAVEGDRVHAFADHVHVVDVLAGAPAVATERGWTLDEVTLLAPVPEPGNHLRHRPQLRQAHRGDRRPEARVPDRVRQGPRARWRPPGGPVRCPEAVRRLDYEGELTIVMGAEGRIAGYCIADDVTGRDLQGREPQWTRAKGADTFCPFGPWVTTTDEVAESAEPRPEDLGQRRAPPGLEHLRSDLRLPGAGRVHRPDVHAQTRTI